MSDEQTRDGSIHETDEVSADRWAPLRDTHLAILRAFTLRLLAPGQVLIREEAARVHQAHEAEITEFAGFLHEVGLQYAAQAEVQQPTPVDKPEATEYHLDKDSDDPNPVAV